ncbi:hypothetical protein BJ741DRAFT_348474 [Chytriomyces cf. hyalinus JEL632]|nr:hypothetical protein BJ741DRAFT_348474 [Chytriomyces cf. hyalinus JEL632]
MSGLSAWLSAKQTKTRPQQQPASAYTHTSNSYPQGNTSDPSEHGSSDTASIYHYSARDDARSIMSTRVPVVYDEPSGYNSYHSTRSLYNQAVKDTSDTRSVKTCITTCTVMGKPHRMQWRSPSRESTRISEHHAAHASNSEILFDEDIEDEDALEATNTRKLAITSKSSENAYLQLPRVHSPLLSDSAMPVVNKFKSPLDRLAASSSVPASRSPLRQYVRPSAMEIAREGWMFYQSEVGFGWDKVQAIATYKLDMRSAILQFYESDDDIHPFSVLDISRMDAIMANSVLAHLPETSQEPVHLFTFTISTGPTCIYLAATASTDRDAWISALKMMTYSSSSAETCPRNEDSDRVNTAKPPPRYSMQTESEETLHLQLQQSQERVLQLEQQLLQTQKELQLVASTAVPNQDIQDDNPVTAAPAPNVINAIDSKMNEILEAIWAAHSTATRTAESIHHQPSSSDPSGDEGAPGRSGDEDGAPATTLSDVEAAVQDLTESMEMRTSRIGKMVHELLSVKEDVLSVKKMMLEGTGFRSASANEVTHDGNTCLSLNGEESNQVLHKVLSSQASTANDLGSLLGIAAESGLAQRMAWEEQTQSAQVRHSELMQLTQEQQHELIQLNKTSFESVLDKLELLVQTIEAGFAGKMHDAHGKLSETIRAALKESTPSNAHARQQSSESSVADDLLNGKLDNITQVIDFVNKSQCRLVNLVTEKLKPIPSSDPNHEQLITQIRDAIKDVILPILETNTSKPGTVPRSMTTSPSRLTLSDEAGDSDRASSRALHTLIMESLANLEGQLVRTSRDIASRHELVEVWMERNHESLKHIQRGVSEVEKMERSASPLRASASSFSVAEKRNHELDFESKAEVFATKLERKANSLLENLVMDSKDVWSSRQERMVADVEALVAEKAVLVQQVHALREDRNTLTSEIKRLEQIKTEAGNIDPICKAVSELEEQLEERVSALLHQIEVLKRERDILSDGGR